jgi:hypothetical protein
VLRLVGLLAYLLVSISIGMTSVAHAMEPQGGMTIAAGQTALVAEFGHTQGDSDEVPADADKGYPHHHFSCHGDHIAAPFECTAIAFADNQTAISEPIGFVPLASRVGDPALRPPQA